MKNKPLVSIMIPSYNQEKFIGKAIQSALAQDYENLEVVVNDDGSTDSTFETACFNDDPRLNCYQNDSNIGHVENYRKLLYKLANGDWCLMLDGDDFLIWDEYISFVAAEFFNKDNVHIIMANLELLYNTGKEHKKLNLNKINDGIKFVQDFFSTSENESFSHTTAIFRRQLAQEIEFYRKNIISTDYESFFRLALHGKVGFVDKAVAVRRKDIDSISSTAKLEERIRNLEFSGDVIRYCAENFPEKLDILKIAEKEYRQEKIHQLFAEQLRNGQFGNAKRIIHYCRENNLKIVGILLSIKVILSLFPSLYYPTKYIYQRIKNKMVKTGQVH